MAGLAFDTEVNKPFQFGDKWLLTIEPRGREPSCSACVFLGKYLCTIPEYITRREAFPQCLNGQRADGRDVHFVEVPPPKGEVA